ncbi:imidazole glycerol phosphate synthase subunit HisF [Winogradskyella sp. PC-19]|uniref:AglZ/HisF2 family acetamidino modification protein n=1 Tax=Winogradskyella sp. PC-19 TaxID=754417 RepID=UPI000B3CCE94|nr:AglZ/HisF2 family acetamidino modification protein [Winogradskyella sp. PC-19]ARV09687.1 imidazole glycerol phosphate synthase subunit HisF [Winogradskyella sp. PC-19]
MLKTRVIPVLSLKGSGIIKTHKFKTQTYLGDPLNAVKIFNEKEVDELVILDIFASKENREPNYSKIKNIATECFMPLAYGGGIKTIEHIKKVFDQGVEKVIINSASTNYQLITNAAKIYGTQSIVVSVDIKKNIWGSHEAYTFSGTKKNKISLDSHIQNIAKAGAGELILQSIDNDSVMKGFDLKLIEKVSNQLEIPIVALGGAGELNHFKEAISHGASAVAAGSMFVFKGKHRAVLINYPTQKDLKNILN